MADNNDISARIAAKIAEFERREEELRALLEKGLHLFTEGIRLFQEHHPTFSAEQKSAEIAELEKLQASLLELQRRVDQGMQTTKLSSLLRAD
ncbi:MAG TPA: hypothetical protein VOA78_15330 [Candidatus Dormibacteraeota bacterium]|nr:hypothetical protein [Candidatus Dormibacteraeota bacterium]